MVCNFQQPVRYFDLNSSMADTLVFIHGLGCASSYEYVPIAFFEMMKKYRIILVDLIGFGYSDKPSRFEYTIDNHATCVFDLLSTITNRNIILYGHSMGGAVAITLASMLGPSLKFLILSESNLDTGGGFFSKKIASYDRNAYLESGNKIMIRESLSERNTHWASTMLNSLPQAVYEGAKSLVDGGRINWRNTLYEISSKSAFIYGEKSLPDSDYEKLKSHGIHLEIVPKAGHSMSVENTSGLATAIENCIKHLTIAST